MKINIHKLLAIGILFILISYSLMNVQPYIYAGSNSLSSDISGIDTKKYPGIKESIQEAGERFLNRVYTKAEIEYCESKKQQKYQHYAARFAAKDAIFKAISKKLNDKYEIGWKDLEILNDEQGRPQVKIKGVQKENIDISISHCKDYAVAMVVMLVEK